MHIALSKLTSWQSILDECYHTMHVKVISYTASQNNIIWELESFYSSAHCAVEEWNFLLPWHPVETLETIQLINLWASIKSLGVLKAKIRFHFGN